MASHWIDLFVWRQLSQFTTVAQEFSLPPGYDRILLVALAAEMFTIYPNHGWQTEEDLLADLESAMHDLDVLNASNAVAAEPEV